MKKIQKKIISFVLSFSILFGTVGNAVISYAAENNSTNYYEDISEFRGDTYEAPPTDGTTVFAGWYEDADFTKPIGTDVKSGPAYAKLVDADVLSLKCQITSGTTLQSTSTNLRMLTSVDNRNYSSVGFKIEINGKTANRTSGTVYRSIKATEGGVVKTFKPNIFSESSNYIMSYMITGVSDSFFSTNIKITPTWTTLDGTVVGGEEKNVLLVDELADFEKGVTMEKPLHEEAFTGSTNADYKMALSTVKYANTNLTNIDASHGEYALMGSVEAGVRWPAFKIGCNGEDLAGKTVRFRVYIDTNGVTPYDSSGNKKASCTTWSKSGDNLDGTTTNTISPGYAWYNKWTDIEITITSNDQPWFILKLNDSTMWTDNPTTVYFDNFYIYEEADFSEGVTFENLSERTLDSFAAKDSGNFRATLSNVKYADSSIGIQGGDFGEYAMAMDATSVRWPAFQVLCNTKGLTGKTLSFMMYIEGDDAKDANGNTKTSAAVASYSDIDYKGTSNTVLTGNAEFNKWVNIKITINSDLQPWVYLNFNSGSTGISIFGDTKVTVYFDNFQISDGPDFGKGITFESLLERELSLFEAKSSGNFRSTLSTVKYADSTIGVQKEEFGEYALVMDVTGVRWPSFKVLCDTNNLKGKIVSFKMYIEGDESVAKDGNGNPKTSIALASYPNIDYQGTANTVLSGMAGFNKWVEVLIEMKSDSQPWIYLNLNSGSTATSIFGNTPVKVYIDNIKVSE